MKTLKLSLIAGLAMFVGSLSAQTYAPTGPDPAGETIDTVAVGSKAKFKVALYYNDIVNLPAIFNPSAK